MPLPVIGKWVEDFVEHSEISVSSKTFSNDQQRPFNVRLVRAGNLLWEFIRDERNILSAFDFKREKRQKDRFGRIAFMIFYRYSC